MGLIKKIFGLGGSETAVSDVMLQAEEVVEKQLDALLSLLSLDVNFIITMEENKINVNFEGNGTEELTDKDGQLLDAMQFYVKRSVQHSLPEAKMGIYFDAAGFREKALAQLEELAEKLKGIALDKNKSVYFRALAPRDRKVVHQHLAKDDRVKSKSVGDGHYKKIKVFPANLKPKKRSNKGSRQNQRNA